MEENPFPVKEWLIRRESDSDEGRILKGTVTDMLDDLMELHTEYSDTRFKVYELGEPLRYVINTRVEKEES